jgi:hypothetical protein
MEIPKELNAPAPRAVKTKFLFSGVIYLSLLVVFIGALMLSPIYFEEAQAEEDAFVYVFAGAMIVAGLVSAIIASVRLGKHKKLLIHGVPAKATIVRRKEVHDNEGTTIKLYYHYLDAYGGVHNGTHRVSFTEAWKLVDTCVVVHGGQDGSKHLVYPSPYVKLV